MNWLDIVLAIVFIMAAFGGAKSGLIKSVVGLVALIVAVIVAVRFYPEFGGWVQQHLIHNQTAARMVGFLIIFLAIIIAGSIVGSILSHAASTIGLGIFDRLGGAVFGLLVAAIIFGLILSGLISLPGTNAIKNAVEGSAIARFLINTFLPWLGSISPFFRDPRGWLNSPR